MVTSSFMPINEDVNIADGETEITAGTYPILQGTDLSNPYMTVHASEGIIAGFTTPSYAGYLDANSELTSPVWYIMAGTVVIDEQGHIEVNAINSAERTIHCILRGQPQGLEESFFESSDLQIFKFIKDGHIYIQRESKIYTIIGSQL